MLRIFTFTFGFTDVGTEMNDQCVDTTQKFVLVLVI